MTGYRDETETLRARVAEVEGKLSAAEAEIAKLRGESAPQGSVESRDPYIGEPLHHVGERELAFQISESGYEAIAQLVRARLGGQVAQVGRSLTGPGFSLTAGEGWTRIRLETDQRILRGSVVSGPLLAGLFGGLPALGIILDLAQHAAVSPWHAAWAIPAIMIGGGVGMRALAVRRAREGKAKHEGLFAAILSLADEHRVVEKASARVRVALEEDDNEAETATDEASVPEGSATAASSS